jgi:hypothetical protein
LRLSRKIGASGGLNASWSAAGSAAPRRFRTPDDPFFCLILARPKAVSPLPQSMMRWWRPALLTNAVRTFLTSIGGKIREHFPLMLVRNDELK